MLTIHPDQIEKMQAARRDEYHHQLAVYYRTNVPDLVAKMDDAALEARIAVAVTKARGHGAVSDTALLQFTTMSLVAGERFDEHPEIKAYLATPGYEPDAKIDELSKSLAGELTSRG